MENKSTKPKRPLRTLRIIINSILLLSTLIIIIQNDKSVAIDFLWTQFNISLAILVFLTGSFGSVMTLIILLFRK